MRIWRRFVLAGLMVVLAAGWALATEVEEPLLDEFRRQLKREYFSVGAVMQYVFDYQNERVSDGNNGFTVATMRLKLRGDFDAGFGYYFQTDFTTSPAILDAFMYYRVSPGLVFRTGQFKSPFSAEHLISSPDIDFVDRSRVVSALVPGRQIGAQINGDIAGRVVNYNMGLFNGNGTGSGGNDNSNFMYAGRLTLSPSIFSEEEESNLLRVGINAAYSNDSSARLANGRLTGFSGERMMVGADVRFTADRILLAGEYIRAELERSGGTESKPEGFYATAGYMITNRVQALMRWDSLDTDHLFPGECRSDMIIGGINFWPTGTSELQLNYIVDSDDNDLKRNQVLINAQIVF